MMDAKYRKYYIKFFGGINMLRSLYSGISGMKVNQTALDVIGNNIANVSTTSFKSGRVRFQDMLSQNINEAMAPGVNSGGVNPKQVGLGVQVAGIDTIVSQGSMQPTSRNLDAAIDGSGYFIVGKGLTPKTNTTGVTENADHSIGNTNGMGVLYTRDGSFTLDSAGNLLTSDGNRVLGYALTVKGGQESVNYTNGLVSAVNYNNADDATLTADAGLVPLVIPDSISRPASTFPAASPIVYFNDPSNGTNTQFPTVTGTFTGATPTNLLVKYDGTAVAPTPVYNYSEDGGTTWLAVGAAGSTLTYNGVTLKMPPVPVAPATSPADGTIFQQALYPKQIDARITSFSIEKDGMIKGILEDGSVTALGQLAMATFKNPAGLSKTGKNLLMATANSGSATIRSGYGSSAASDNSKGYGDALQGMLEMSNVDLAEQFTNMIVSSRAFQASSKVIQTGDEILQDILGLKR